MDDLRQQNRFLYEENQTLKRSLEELISINTELTESIEEFNNSHVENFPHINQQEIEQLALRVIELEQELEREKSERERDQQQASSEPNNTVEETLKVIEELVNSFRIMQ
jgi:predicted RNase H-like nuclease (RuvC/YqgF family)